MEQERAGQQLGNYRLLRTIGSGGSATVYLGEHIILRTQAAIKVLNVVDLTDKQQEQFLEEARTVSKLTHRHIIRVLECGIERGVHGSIPYIVMSYAPDGNARKKYPRGSLVPFDVVVSYTKQIADALHYAHSKQIVHCDVKPENILISSPNEIVLSDFGIAGQSQTDFLGRPELLTHPGETPGTPSYMAPERLIQGIRIRASDQYALGIVVYEWLTGEPPFTGNVERIIHMHAMTPPLSLRTKNPLIPSEVELVVMKALEKDPGQRYAEIKEFARALEEAFRYSAQLEIIAPAPAPAEPPIKEHLHPLAPAIIELQPTQRRITIPLPPIPPSPLPASPQPIAQPKTPQPQPRVSPSPPAQAATPQQTPRQSLPPNPQHNGNAQQQMWYQQGTSSGAQQTYTASPHNATTVNVRPPQAEDEDAFDEFKNMFKVPRGSFDNWFDKRFATLPEHRWFRRINMLALFLSTFIIAIVLHSWYMFFLCLLTIPIFYFCIRLVKTIFAGFLGIVLALYWGWVAWTLAEPLNAAVHWFPPTLIIATIGFIFALFIHMRYVTDRLP